MPARDLNVPLLIVFIPEKWRSPWPDRSNDDDRNKSVTREELIGFLNEDLAGEYQAIISYVIYSQVLKGANYMNIAKELEVHAAEELSHALIISKQIDYLGGMPVSAPKPVQKTS